MILRFISKFGTPGMTALSAGAAYGACLRTQAISSKDLTESHTVESAILRVAASDQSFKPQSKSKKQAILTHLDQLQFKALISYVCICLIYEANARGHSYSTWITWIEIIDERLSKRSVPPFMRYGYGAKSLEEYLHRFRADQIFMS